MAGQPAVVCGTAGAGTVHLFNGLMDARKEYAPVIAIAGDVETKIIDTNAFKELNPYKLFDAAALYVGRVTNPEQARAIFGTAIPTATVDKGPTVISLPGDVGLRCSGEIRFAHRSLSSATSASSNGALWSAATCCRAFTVRTPLTTTSAFFGRDV